MDNSDRDARDGYNDSDDITTKLLILFTGSLDCGELVMGDDWYVDEINKILKAHGIKTRTYEENEIK